MYLRFDVENQVLKRIDDNKLADYSNEYLTCAFDFSKDWTPFSKFAIFKHENKNYRVAIVENECIVPGDVLQDDRFVITLYGVNDDIRITTNKVLIHLRDSGFVTDYDESGEFNPDMTETLMELVDTKVDKTVYNTTIENINENISELNENKVSVASFNDEIEDINNNLDNLDNVKVNVSSFNEEIETINNTISELDNDKTINIIKQAVADTGYFSTYVISQGGTQLSTKINIPKDYLLKSASIKKCTVKDVPIPGLNVGDYYFDWVLNTADDSETEKHLYLNANVLTDVYIGDNETIIVIDGVISVKKNVFAFKTHTHSKSDITDFAHTHVESDITDLKDYALNEDVPTRVSELENDSGFVNDLSDYYTKAEVDELIFDLNNKVVLTGDKSIMQVDEVLDLTVKIKEDGFMADNKDVFFYEVI